MRHQTTQTKNKHKNNKKESKNARLIRQLDIPREILTQHVQLIAFCMRALEKEAGVPDQLHINTDDIINGLGRRDDITLAMKGEVSMRLTFGG